jgi:putative NADH-flavin reductase
MKILIYGASGVTGQHLVNQALKQGHYVTAFARSPDKIKINDEKLKVIQGDVINYHQVNEAIKGQEAVLCALGASSPFRYDQSIVDGTRNIIKSMESNGVTRFIYMSFVGVKESRNNAGFVIKYIAPRLLSSEIAGHENREQMIKSSKLNWTIVRPPTLTKGKHVAKFRSGEEITSKGFVVSISRSDVADFMLRQISDNTFLHKVPRVMY